MPRIEDELKVCENLLVTFRDYIPALRALKKIFEARDGDADGGQLNLVIDEARREFEES